MHDGRRAGGGGGGARSKWTDWQTVEATANAFFAFALGFCLAVAGIVIIFASREEPEGRWLAAAAVPILIGEGFFLLWLKHALERGGLRPFVPQFALRQVRWPLLLRPLVACWWAAHFAVALAFLVMLEDLTAGWQGEDVAAALRGYVALAFASGTASHCGLMYLLLAATALWRHERLVMALWRYRLAIDLAVTAIVIGIARLW